MTTHLHFTIVLYDKHDTNGNAIVKTTTVPRDALKTLCNRYRLDADNLPRLPEYYPITRSQLRALYRQTDAASRASATPHDYDAMIAMIAGIIRNPYLQLLGMTCAIENTIPVQPEITDAEPHNQP